MSPLAVRGMFFWTGPGTTGLRTPDWDGGTIPPGRLPLARRLAIRTWRESGARPDSASHWDQPRFSRAWNSKQGDAFGCSLPAAHFPKSLAKTISSVPVSRFITGTDDIKP